MKFLTQYTHSVLLFLMIAALVIIVGIIQVTTGFSMKVTNLLNPLYTGLWRCGVYFLLGGLWPYLIRKKIPSESGVDVELVVHRSRKKLLVLMAAFELVIVQNRLWPILLSGWSLLYGR